MTLGGAFTNLATLATDRLCIRPMQVDDAEALFALKSDPEVTVCYGQEPQRSIDETKAWIQRGLASYERHEAMMWTLTMKGDDAAIGECCFWNFDAGFHYAEIGYELHPAHWHKGLMTEALAAILSYGFDEIGLHRVEANPLATNRSSQNILLKLGFKHEGTLRQRQFFRDRYEDQLYFGLLKSEWTGRSAGI